MYRSRKAVYTIMYLDGEKEEVTGYRIRDNSAGTILTIYETEDNGYTTSFTAIPLNNIKKITAKVIE